MQMLVHVPVTALRDLENRRERHLLFRCVPSRWQLLRAQQ